MRWIFCALLLSISPAIAWADKPALAVTPGESPLDTRPGAPFFATKTVRATVTRAANSNGSISVTFSTPLVNGGVPFDLTEDDPADPANPPGPSDPHTFSARNLPFVTPAAWAIDNTTYTVTATDSDDPSNPAIVTVTGTFDDVKPSAQISVVSAGVVDDETEFDSIRVAGSMSDNDPEFRALIRIGFVDLFALPSGAAFNQRIDLNPGLNTIIARPVDRAGNFPDPNGPGVKLEIRRVTACDDPNFVAASTAIRVDRFDDLPDPIPDDDICDVRPDLRPGTGHYVPPSLTKCTLRAAIQTANHRAGNDVISLPGGTFVLRREGVAGDAEGDASGDLDITSNIRIVGLSRDSTVIDARKLGDRVFDVADGAKLELLRLSVTGGRTPKPPKGAQPEAGGCVRSRGILNTNNMAFLGCKSEGVGGAVALEPSSDPEAGAKLTCTIVARSQAKADGGAISVDSEPLTLRNSTVSFNSAGLRGGGLSAVNDEAPIDVQLRNVTMSYNKAKLAGGSLDVASGVTAKLNNCTLTNNAAKVGVTVSTMDGGELEISNSIIGDAKLACDATAAQNVVSMGGNVERGNSCLASPNTGDQVSKDPLLDRLATNGGTPTHALKLGSPALDQAGTGPVPCEPLDARLKARGDWPGAPNAPGSDTATPPFCDAGAFERFVTPAP